MPAFHSKTHTKPEPADTRTISRKELLYLRACEKVYYATWETTLVAQETMSPVPSLSSRIRIIERRVKLAMEAAIRFKGKA